MKFVWKKINWQFPVFCSVLSGLLLMLSACQTDYSDFAVLYRSGFLSRVIEKKFTENGIPYEIIGGVKFFQRMEVQDIVAYLRLVAFDDDISLKRIINKPRRKFGRTRLQQLVALQAGGKSLYQTLKENLLYSACRQHGDIGSVLDQVKSRRYTMARLKRICMCALLGLYDNPMDKLAGLYIRILGIRRDAMHLLSQMNEKAALPIVTRFADAERLNESQRRMLEADMLSSDIAAMATPCPAAAKFDFSQPLLIV